MTAFVALLRAVNVGGRKLVMKDLKAIADELGLGSARTFIASGNLLFSSTASEEQLRKQIEARLREHMSAEVRVLIRTATELADVAANNPFKDFPPNKTAAIFLNSAPGKDALAGASNVTDEILGLGKREIYVAYPGGMGQSKLKLPAAAGGTARNMNSVAKMAALLKDIE